uniref:Uncharacterized protein n=1 Tax=Melopsittacus undulatus TaxID=13146 RepID=A0A8V5GWB6_MELUD
MVKQPDYVFLPVNLTQDWYADSGSEVLELVTKQLLRREKRVVGLIIAGIVALITAITVTTIASISLSASIQTAAFVNSLSVNISHAFKLQEEWDEKIELTVNALKDTVDLIGRQVEILSIKESLRCHTEYQEICVTPIKWNNTISSNAEK